MTTGSNVIGAGSGSVVVVSEVALEVISVSDEVVSVEVFNSVVDELVSLEVSVVTSSVLLTTAVVAVVVLATISVPDVVFVVSVVISVVLVLTTSTEETVVVVLKAAIGCDSGEILFFSKSALNWLWVIQVSSTHNFCVFTSPLVTLSAINSVALITPWAIVMPKFFKPSITVSMIDAADKVLVATGEEKVSGAHHPIFTNTWVDPNSL